MLHDFAELTGYLVSMNEEERKEITIEQDRPEIRVFRGDEQIFAADEINFVWAFFMSYHINIDENMEAAK